MRKWMFVVTLSTLLCCGPVPFDVCTAEDALRCNNTTLERCSGQNWYAVVDCAEIIPGGYVCGKTEKEPTCLKR